MNTRQHKERDTVKKELKLLLIDLKILPPTYNVNENEDYLEGYENNVDLFNAVQNVFPEINPISCAFILNKVKKYEDFDMIEFINLFHICNSVLDHYKHFSCLKLETIVQRYYTNTFFENLLSKKEKDTYYYCEYEIPIKEYNDSFIKDNKRRQLDIDNNEYFSYTSYLCGLIRNNKECDFKADCPFAHNQNEIQYHPLFFKKFKCRNNHKELHCPYYHNEEERDISIELNGQNVISIITELKKVVQPDEYNKYNQDEDKKRRPCIIDEILPTEFNVETYKMCKCPLGDLCKLEQKLCLNYHNDEDRRRHPFLYSEKPCSNLLTKGSFNKNKKCKNGDNCPYSHNQYEYLYHPKNFRKQKCPMEREEGDCLYRLCCPFKHEDDKENLKWEGIDFKDSVFHEENIDKNAVIICNADLIREYYLDKIEDYKNKQEGKLKQLRTIIDKHLCPSCKKNCMLKEKEYSVHMNGSRILEIMCISCRQKIEKSINARRNETIKGYIFGKTNN